MRCAPTKRQLQDKIHYKMYKSGKYWSMAMITLATISLSALTVKADTPPVTATKVTTAAAGSATTTPTSVALLQSSAAAAPLAAKSAASPTILPAHDEQPVVKATTKSAQPVSAASATSIKASVASAQPADSMAAGTVNPSSVAATHAPAPDVTTKAATTPPPATKQTTPVAKVVASGQNGTSKWQVTQTGEFTLGAGTLATNHFDSDETSRIYDWQDRVRHVQVTGPVKLPAATGAGLFQDWHFLTKFDGGKQLDFSEATDINHMFANDRELIDLDVDNWHVGKVTDFSGLFSNDGALSAINVKYWHTDSAITMQDMFQGTFQKNPYRFSQKLEVGSWHVGKVKNMSGMFANSQTTEVDVSQWHVSQVTDMSGMFAGMGKLDSLAVDQWQVGHVTNMANMFRENTADFDVSHWDVSQVTDMHGMFLGVAVPTLNLNHWQVQHVTNMSRMFAWSGLTSVQVNDWQTSQVTNMSHMFEQADLANLALNHWDVSQVTNMQAMFKIMPNLKDLQVSDWQTSKVTNMAEMFMGIPEVSPLTTLAIDRWDTSQVQDFSRMFWGQTHLRNLDVHRWQVQNGRSFARMFAETDVRALDLSAWQFVSTIVNTRHMLDAPNLSRIRLNGTFQADGYSTFAVPQTETGYWYNLKTGAAYTTEALAELYGQWTTDQVADCDTHILGPLATYAWYPDRSQLVVQDALIKQHTPWQNQFVISQLLDDQGQVLNPDQVATSQLTVTPVDTATLGHYPVSVTYTSVNGRRLTANAQVTVITPPRLAGTDVTLIAGPKQTNDHLTLLVQGNDEFGQPLTLTDTHPRLTTTIVDAFGHPVKQLVLTYPGQYWVNSQYQTLMGTKLTHRSRLNVLASQAAVRLTPGTQLIGPTQPATVAQQLVVLDAFGRPVGLTDPAIQVTWLAEQRLASPQVPGPYLVTATYTDIAGNIRRDQAQLMLVASQANFTVVPALTLQKDQPFAPQQVVLAAWDEWGQPLSKQRLTFMSTVDRHQAGQYAVQVRYQDTVGNAPIIKTVPVVVIQSVLLQLTPPADLIAGPKTQFIPASVITQAQDEYGQPLTPSQLTIVSTVNPHQVGHYWVTVSYGNHQAQVPVNVRASQATLVVKPTMTLTVGQTWLPQTAYVSGSDALGQPLPWSAVTVVGTANTTQVGTTTLYYQYEDQAGNLIVRPVVVTVVVPASFGQQPEAPIGETGNHHNDGQTTAHQQYNASQIRVVTTVNQPTGTAVSTGVSLKKPITTLPATDESTPQLTVLAGLSLLLSSLLSLGYWRRHF